MKEVPAGTWEEGLHSLSIVSKEQTTAMKKEGGKTEDAAVLDGVLAGAGTCDQHLRRGLRKEAGKRCVRRDLRHLVRQRRWWGLVDGKPARVGIFFVLGLDGARRGVLDFRQAWERILDGLFFEPVKKRALGDRLQMAGPGIQGNAVQLLGKAKRVQRRVKGEQKQFFAKRLVRIRTLGKAGFNFGLQLN